MRTDMKNPAPLAGGDRARTDIKVFDDYSNSPSIPYPQAFIISRYRVRPALSSLICDLSGIGGRAR